jgi:hypothetical protein
MNECTNELIWKAQQHPDETSCPSLFTVEVVASVVQHPLSIRRVGSVQGIFSID